MDEPSEGLAPAIVEHLIETFKRLASEGLAILLIEQNLGIATSIAERQLVMVAGSITAETTAAELAPTWSCSAGSSASSRSPAALMATVVCIGTLDTKGNEYAFLCERLRGHGVECVVVDAGVHEPVGLTPDIGRDEVARAAGADVAALAAAGDRGAAVTAMAAGVRS